MTGRDWTHEVGELIIKKLDGSLNADEFARLDTLLSENPDAVQYYIKAIMTNALLEDKSSIPVDKEVLVTSELLKALIELEETSPAVDSVNQQPVIEAMKPQPHKIPLHQLKVRLFTATLAAIILVVLLLTAHFHSLYRPNSASDSVASTPKVQPSPKTSIAVLTDQEHEQWNMASALHVGDPLWSDTGPLNLQRGLAEITFTHGAEIIVEAPALFELEGPNQIFLQQGKLAAKVNKEATGFTVRTPLASMVDYGTEFGILVNRTGQAETHVFKGEVDVRSGSNPLQFDSSVRLKTNEVCDVDPNGNLARSDRPAQLDLFQRHIPTPYERVALELSPVSYWRFDTDDSHALSDVLNPKEVFNFGIHPEHLIQGPSVGKGKRVNALVFNESSMPLQIPEMPIPPTIDKTSGYSLALWIRLDQIKQQDILYRDLEQGLGSRRVLELTSDGHFLHSMIESNGEIKGVVISRTQAIAGQWYHVVVGRTAYGGRKIFVNGKEEGYTEFGTFRYGKNVVLGICVGAFNDLHATNASPHAKFQGAIGDIAVFNRLLTSSEVEQLYHSAE